MMTFKVAKFLPKVAQKLANTVYTEEVTFSRIAKTVAQYLNTFAK